MITRLIWTIFDGRESVQIREVLLYLDLLLYSNSEPVAMIPTEKQSHVLFLDCR